MLVARELLNGGADTNKIDCYDETPLGVARSGKKLELITLLNQHLEANG